MPGPRTPFPARQPRGSPGRSQGAGPAALPPSLFAFRVFVCLWCCAELPGGQSRSAAAPGGDTEKGWRILPAPPPQSPFHPLFLHKACEVFLLPSLVPPVLPSSCPRHHPCLAGLSGADMPYLYQDSKARPAAHPGAARDTHSSGKGYEQLKRECLTRGVLFEDPDFPACNSSLFFSENPPIPFVWKRPGVSMPLCSLLPSRRCASGMHQIHGVFWSCGGEVWAESLPTSGAVAQDWDARLQDGRAGRLHSTFQV